MWCSKKGRSMLWRTKAVISKFGGVGGKPLHHHAGGGVDVREGPQGVDEDYGVCLGCFVAQFGGGMGPLLVDNAGELRDADIDGGLHNRVVVRMEER